MAINGDRASKNNSKSNNASCIILTILAICFLATGGIFVRMSDLPPVATGFYRVLFSIPLLLPFIRSKELQVRRSDLYWMLIAGVFLALDLIVWNTSFTLTTVANGNLLANLVPFTIIPVSYFIYRKRFSKLFYISFVVTLLGVVILLMGKIKPSVNNFKGDLLASITSVFYAMFLLTVDKVRNRASARLIMFISAFGSIVTLFIAMIIMEGFYYPSSIHAILPLIGLALVSQILGQGLLSFTMRKVEVALSSLLVLSQPAIAGVYSLIVFKEYLSIQEIVGIVIVLSGIFIAKKSFE